jgi:hypothetical protein
MPISLNHSQQAAVLSQHARVLALASPGSGKTRSLVARAANLIYRGATAPRRIVIITFTNAAADEIRERIATVILPEEAKAIGYIGTLHGYCLRLLDQYGDSIGYRHGVSVIDEERAEALLADALAATGYKISKAALADAKLELGPRAAFDESSRHSAKAKIVVGHYYAKLKRGNSTDYDGLLADALTMLEKNAGKPDQMPRIEHLLVDEYQDSTDADQRIYQALKPTNMWVVGDPDQAIFSFRGGRMANILALAESDEWEKHYFQTNYRSDGAICDAANLLIFHNEDRVSKTMDCASASQGEISWGAYATDQDEISGVLLTVSGMLDNGHQLHQIAILARSNDIVGQFKEAAHRRGILVAQSAMADPEKLIPGWKFARATVDMLNAPSSDFHFHYWLTLARGKEMAEKMAQSSGIMRQPIAATYFGGGIPSRPEISELPSRLLTLGVTEAAVRALDQIIITLPVGAGLAEVSLAMRNAADSMKPEKVLGGLTVGTIHCSPGDEPVLTTDGYRAIQSLNPNSDRLLSYMAKCNQLLRGQGRDGYPFILKARHYSGAMLTLETAESRTRVTPEHRVRARYSERFYNKSLVYLMRRGKWWRVGVTGTAWKPYRSGGAPGRLATEQGDDCWILGVYETRREALIAEQVFQVRYGIPGLRFEETRIDSQWTSADLHAVHEQLVKYVEAAAARLLKDVGLLMDSPLYSRGGQSREIRSGAWFETVAANLISDYMEIPVAAKEDWLKLSPCSPRPLPVTVKSNPFDGQVYSLDVQPHHFYISGGAVVHNSAKGREWPVVFMPAMEIGVLPNSRAMKEPGGMEEERRLAFVGATRAAQRLILSWARLRAQPWGQRAMVAMDPSPFISELLGN